jgi:hypothetical protein
MLFLVINLIWSWLSNWRGQGMMFFGGALIGWTVSAALFHMNNKH